MAIVAAVCAKVPEAKLGIIFLPMVTFTAGNVSDKKYACVSVCVCSPGPGWVGTMYGLTNCCFWVTRCIVNVNSFVIHTFNRVFTFPCCVFAAGKRCESVHEQNGLGPVCVSECVSMHV